MASSNEPGFDVLLQRLLPQLGLRIKSYRKKRRTIRGRLHRRMGELGLSDYAAYAAYVDQHAGERACLRHMLALTVSRFFRNREDWLDLADTVFPELGALALEDSKTGQYAGAPPTVRAASIGCACGEEPYTLVIAWKEWAAAGVELRVLALDLEEACLQRAGQAVYQCSSFRSMPAGLLERYFDPLPDEPDCYRAVPAVRQPVEYARFDYTGPGWPRGLHLLLVRHSAFFYLDEAGCRRALAKAYRSLVPGGWLFVGSNETIPPEPGRWEKGGRNCYRKAVIGAVSTRE